MESRALGTWSQSLALKPPKILRSTTRRTARCDQSRAGGKLDASNVTAMGFTAGSVVEKNNKDLHMTQKYKIKRLEEHVVIVVSLTDPDTELTLDYAKLIEYMVNKSAKAKVTIRNNNP